MFDIIKFSLPLLSAAIFWFLNERRKRSAEEYRSKEEKYSALLDALKGFYISTEMGKARELKEAFISELNKCWLYCPDEVILKAYAFLEAVHADARTNYLDGDKEKLLGELVLAIRRDLLSRRVVTRTGLSAQDFKHLDVT